jgi:predicted enzyme related to lactoylglutathione lyase
MAPRSQGEGRRSITWLVYEELKSRGVEFATDVLEFPRGYAAQFLDPDGNRLQIHEGRSAT